MTGRSGQNPEADEGLALRANNRLLLAVDTCGPAGSVALARTCGPEIQILGEVELEGRSYSSTLIAAVRELLVNSEVQLGDLHAILAVNGPGSFTGVRVGLSAVKGLALGRGIPVAAVSRLEVLAAGSDCSSAALDAHRHEVFLRLGRSELPGSPDSGELLAAQADLATLPIPSGPVAVCDDPAAELLASAWPTVRQVRSTPPTAADALCLCVDRLLAGPYADLALLDAHYLRRSDAEIFGEALARARSV